MRYKNVILLGILYIETIGLSGCTQGILKQQTIREQPTEPSHIEAVIEQGTETETETANIKRILEQSTETETIRSESSTRQPIKTQSESITETTLSDLYLEDAIYIGEYLDSIVNEPNLEIAAGEDHHYIIQIGIYRLTFLSDGIGELTADGMNFTATDAAGNPISGVITVDGEIATLTFTNSTWEYLKNGATFQYTKSSAIPNILGE